MIQDVSGFSNKFDLLQKRAVTALNYALQNVINKKTGKLFTQFDLADELKVGRALVNHIINGRRSFDLSKLELLERIIKTEIFTVTDPEILKDIDTIPKKFTNNKDNITRQPESMMEEKLKSFIFYPLLLQSIKSIIEEKYTGIEVVVRPTTQYVSLNIFGNLVRKSINKSNLHLLFFRSIDVDGKPQFKCEFMISNDRLKKFDDAKPWYANLIDYLEEDNASVTDYIHGKPVINKKRPVYKIRELSDSEIESLANLSLAVFQTQMGLE